MMLNIECLTPKTLSVNPEENTCICAAFVIPKLLGNLGHIYRKHFSKEFAVDNIFKYYLCLKKLKMRLGIFCESSAS